MAWLKRHADSAGMPLKSQASHHRPVAATAELVPSVVCSPSPSTTPPPTAEDLEWHPLPSRSDISTASLWFPSATASVRHEIRIVRMPRESDGSSGSSKGGEGGDVFVLGHELTAAATFRRTYIEARFFMALRPQEKENVLAQRGPHSQ